MTDNYDLLGTDSRHRIHSVHSASWGTDGSCSEGTAGYGIKEYGGEGELTREAYEAHGLREWEYLEQRGLEISARLTGKQTINRAEAMAVLHTLLLASNRQDIHLYVDSQTTIDNMEKMWSDKKARHRHHKDIANFSIFQTINQIRIATSLADSHVHTHKVAAHQKRYEGVYI